MNWEPWTGCVPYSEGCKFCYYYGPYAKHYGQNELIDFMNHFREIGEKVTIMYIWDVR